MIYEVRKGRACEDALQAQTIEMNKLMEKEMAQGVAINLAEGQISSYEFIVQQWSDRYDIMTEKIETQKKLFTAKIKRWVRIAVGEGVFIVVLLIILI